MDNLHDTTFKLIDEMTRLKTMEKEYRYLLTLINILAERGTPDQSVTITISKQDMVKGKDWREILELAMHKNGDKE